MTLQDFADFLNSAGVIGVFLIVAWLIGTDRLVTGNRFNEMKADRDWWRDIATTNLKVAEQVAQEMIDRGKRVGPGGIEEALRRERGDLR